MLTRLRTGSAGFVNPEDLDEVIDHVVTRVLGTRLDGRTAEQRDQLTASRPSIPQDVDRALLLDLSDALRVYDLSEQNRFQITASERSACFGCGPHPHRKGQPRGWD
jgi:hypothetical protein